MCSSQQNITTKNITNLKRRGVECVIKKKNQNQKKIYGPWPYFRHCWMWWTKNIYRKVDDIQNRSKCQRSIKRRNNIVHSRLKFLTVVNFDLCNTTPGTLRPLHNWLQQLLQVDQDWLINEAYLFLLSYRTNSQNHPHRRLFL